MNIKKNSSQGKEECAIKRKKPSKINSELFINTLNIKRIMQLNKFKMKKCNKEKAKNLKQYIIIILLKHHHM